MNVLAATAVLALLILVATDHVATAKLWWVIPAVAIMRTTVDVSRTWRFYAGL